MFSWIIQISLISIILIFLVHHLIHFFKNTLTVPKIKDLVHSPNQKYKDIFDTILNTNANTNSNTNVNTNENTNANVKYTEIDLLPKDMLMSNDILTDNPVSMKTELKNYLKAQMDI